MIIFCHRAFVDYGTEMTKVGLLFETRSLVFDEPVPPRSVTDEPFIPGRANLYKRGLATLRLQSTQTTRIHSTKPDASVHKADEAAVNYYSCSERRRQSSHACLLSARLIASYSCMLIIPSYYSAYEDMSTLLSRSKIFSRLSPRKPNQTMDDNRRNMR